MYGEGCLPAFVMCGYGANLSSLVAVLVIEMHCASDAGSSEANVQLKVTPLLSNCGGRGGY